MNRMDHDHPRWQEFLDRLEGPDGCDFQELQAGQLRPEGYSLFEKMIWRCKGGHDKTYATVLLSEMGDIDIPASLAFFDAAGGHCDCEILFNVA